MSPYARCVLRQQRLRDAENMKWAARGDLRRTGPEAREHMRETLSRNEEPSAVEALTRLLGPSKAWLKKLKELHSDIRRKVMR